VSRPWAASVLAALACPADRSSSIAGSFRAIALSCGRSSASAPMRATLAGAGCQRHSACAEFGRVTIPMGRITEASGRKSGARNRNRRPKRSRIATRDPLMIDVGVGAPSKRGHRRRPRRHGHRRCVLAARPACESPWAVGPGRGRRGGRGEVLVPKARLWRGRDYDMLTSEYFRRQPEVYLRIALLVSNSELSKQMALTADKYLARAASMDDNSNFPRSGRSSLSGGQDGNPLP
jgi:hypothetical protein